MAGWKKCLGLGCFLALLLPCALAGAADTAAADTEGDIVAVNGNTEYGIVVNMTDNMTVETIAETSADTAAETSADITAEMSADTALETSADTAAETPAETVSGEVSDILGRMTLEEKVAQLFFITPEALTGSGQVTAAGEETRRCFSEFPVGGLTYLSPNILSREQVTEMLGNIQKISRERIGLPILLAVDEEGGRVRRVSGSGVEGIPYVPDMLSIGATGDREQARQTGALIGGYLAELGFNVDFAPVADVFSNPENTVIGDRSFGYTAREVAPMVAAEVEGLRSQGVCATLKHFPGHGNTAGDSHTGYVYNDRTLDELCVSELVPFAEGIESGAEFVMVGHISLPNILGDSNPVTFSHYLLTEFLRGEMGFEGIIITDALNMGAVVDSYSSGEAAILALEAGADMLLMPADFQTAYYAVLDAVQSGRVSEGRIDQSLERIVKLKLGMQ